MKSTKEVGNGLRPPAQTASSAARWTLQRVGLLQREFIRCCFRSNLAEPIGHVGSILVAFFPRHEATEEECAHLP
jgi:hypothetical protein